MRILAVSLLVLAGSASAQSPPAVDCDAAKNSTVPVELAYHGQDGTRTVVQVYPEKPGDYVVWRRETLPPTRPNPPVFVTKGTFADGGLVSAEMWTTFVGKYSHRAVKYAPDGLPRNFDHRSDVTYKMHSVTTDGDGTTEDKSSAHSYRFRSEEAILVGSCVLQAIHGETDATNDAGRARHSFQIYFPELRISATATDAEPIVDGLSTVFSEIKPAN